MSSNTMIHPDSPTGLNALSQQAPRRALAGAWALCCLAFVALAVFEVKGVVWFILIALTLATDLLLYAATHRVTDRPTSTLDEREQAVRNRAYRAAYLAVFYGITIAVAGGMLLFFTGHEVGARWLAHPANHPSFLTGIGLATLQLVALLPTAIVSWTERDEPGEDA